MSNFEIIYGADAVRQGENWYSKSEDKLWGLVTDGWFYSNQNWRFSNFAAVLFMYELRICKSQSKMYKAPTAEHVYQASKFCRPDMTAQEFSATEMYSVINEILDSPDPGVAKKIANSRRDLWRDDWEEVKFQIMLDIKREQIRQNPRMAQNLVDTGDIIIVKNSPTDVCWGCGLNSDGENWLGMIYMIIREELRNEGRSRLREQLGLI